MEITEVVQFIESNKENQDLTSALDKLGLIKESVVEKVREYSDDELLDVVTKNQKIHDNLYNKVRDKFISKTLGVDTKELTDEHRKLELIPKTEFEKVNSEFNMFKNQTVVKGAFGDNFELLEKHIDYTKEIEPQIETVKTKFSKLFEVDNTPKGKMKEVSPTPTTPKTQEDKSLEAFKKGMGMI